jgi:dTDP-4-dehydrorhamnose reductase
VLSPKELDISDANSVKEYLAIHQPDLVINAAAYTAVDKAETGQEKAYAVDDIRAKNLVTTFKGYGICLLHESTDFVFDGT